MLGSLGWEPEQGQRAAIHIFIFRHARAPKNLRSTKAEIKKSYKHRLRWILYLFYVYRRKSACWVLVAGNRRNSFQGQRGAIHIFIFRLSAMCAPKNLRSTKAEIKKSFSALFMIYYIYI